MMSSFGICSCITHCMGEQVSSSPNLSCCESSEINHLAWKYHQNNGSLRACVEIYIYKYIYVHTSPPEFSSTVSTPCFNSVKSCTSKPPPPKREHVEIEIEVLFCRKKGKENLNCCLICHCCCKKLICNHETQ